MMKRSQAVSMDVMLAIVIFIGTIFVFYVIFSASQTKTDKVLEKDASRVLKSVSSEGSDVGIMDGTELDEAKLEQLLGEDYKAIKDRIRTEKDFCIFLEDENGDIVYTSPGQPGIGSDKIKISDVPCD